MSANLLVKAARTGRSIARVTPESAGWRYVGGMNDACIREFRVPHYDSFDLGASFDFDESRLAGLQLRVGLENVTDEDPPIIPCWNSANTEASQYDVLGRRYFVSLRYSF